MERTLYELTLEIQSGSQEAMMTVIEKFTPLIKKYARKLGYDGADIDLIIALIEIVKAIPISKKDSLKKEEQIIGYISTSIKNKYIWLSKKYGNISAMELPLDFEETSAFDSNLEEQIFVHDLLDKLTASQRNIIIKKYIKSMSNVEIAKELGISRQAVNRTKCRALKKLKDYLELCELYD